jgi:hypothetical protein
MAQLRGEIIQGRRGGTLLRFDNHLYKKNKQQTNRIYWECQQSNCNIRVRSSTNDNSLLLAAPAQHGHPPDLVQLDYLKVMNTAIHAVQNDLANPVPALFEDVADDLERRNVLIGGNPIPDFSTLRSTLYRSRNLLLPAIPHNIQDIDFNLVDAQWKETLRNDRFLLRVSNSLFYFYFFLTFPIRERLKTS